MSSENLDYAAFLADLEAKRTAIDNAINAIRQVLNLGAEQGVAAVVGQKKDQSTDQSIQFDSFFGMSGPDAVRKYLNMMKRPQLGRDIVQALKDGGLPSTSSNIGNVVGPTLSRMKSAGDLIQVQGKWALTEWYPAGARDRAQAVEHNKTKKKKKPATKSMAKRGAATRPEPAAPAQEPKSSPTMPTQDQIVRIKALHGQGKSYGEIAKEVGLHHFVVMRVLKPEKAGKPNPDATGAEAQG